jgi:hypothetical protein
VAIPFAKALDTFVKCISQTLILRLVGHSLPALDKKLEAGYNAPHGGRAFTREALLGFGWLLTKVRKEEKESNQTYPEHIPDKCEAVPIP